MKRDWYRHPRYYEAIFGVDTQREMDFLEAVARRYGGAAGGKGPALLLEPACGAGRLVKEAAARGFEVIGYDVSPQMLAYARARLTSAERGRTHLYRARMERFAPRRWWDRVDLAFNLVSTFRYLDTEAAALAHLRATWRLLRPGGLYVLGFHLTDAARTTVERERWRGSAGRARVLCETRESPPDLRRRRSRMFNRLTVHQNGKTWKIETDWCFRTYGLDQAVELFQRAGFERVALYNFDYRVERPMGEKSRRLDRVWILRRRSKIPS